MYNYKLSMGQYLLERRRVLKLQLDYLAFRTRREERDLYIKLLKEYSELGIAHKRVVEC